MQQELLLKTLTMLSIIQLTDAGASLRDKQAAGGNEKIP
jgi:hypothetical protein